jgi:hypothetical protein
VGDITARRAVIGIPELSCIAVIRVVRIFSIPNIHKSWGFLSAPSTRKIGHIHPLAYEPQQLQAFGPSSLGLTIIPALLVLLGERATFVVSGAFLPPLFCSPVVA